MKFSMYPIEKRLERECWMAYAYPVNPEWEFEVEVPYVNDWGEMIVGSKGL